MLFAVPEPTQDAKVATDFFPRVVNIVRISVKISASAFSAKESQETSCPVEVPVSSAGLQGSFIPIFLFLDVSVLY